MRHKAYCNLTNRWVRKRRNGASPSPRDRHATTAQRCRHCCLNMCPRRTRFDVEPLATERAASRGWKQPRPIESPPKPKICPLDIAVARRLLEKRLIRPIARLISKLAFKNTVALRQHKKRNDKRWQHQTASEPRTNIAQTFAERVQFVRRRAAAPPWPQRPSHLFVAPLAQ